MIVFVAIECIVGAVSPTTAGVRKRSTRIVVFPYAIYAAFANRGVVSQNPFGESANGSNGKEEVDATVPP